MRRLTLLSLLFLPSLAFAQDAPTSRPAAPVEGKIKEEKKEEKKEDLSVTQHSVTIGETKLDYEATAGTLPLTDYAGEDKAKVFFVSYVKQGVADPATRPLLFSFNGGPGSSSVWLHLGALGPRRIVMGDDQGQPPKPPYRLTDNAHSWLDLADLVFVDPVSTGYSRPIEGQNAKQFHGLQEDIKWVGEFIRLFTTRYQRWASPKFLAGESYGTTRAAGLASHLQGKHGMYLNGIVLVSPVLNFQTIRFNTGNDMPYWLYLPTYTATAWYHKKLEPELQKDLQATLREVETFARGDYLLTLAAGDTVPETFRAAIAKQLARFTGLDVETVLRARLRISNSLFTKSLLRDTSRTVGRLDSRYKGIDHNDAGSRYDYDPSYAAIQGPYTGCLNDYVRRELGYESDQPYEILTGRVHPWSYASSANRYVNVADGLREAISKNRDLHVLVCAGYYDLATPYFAADYTVSHLGLDPTLRGNVQTTYYESGHMMYVRQADLLKLKQDVAAFFARALKTD